MAVKSGIYFFLKACQGKYLKVLRPYSCEVLVHKLVISNVKISVLGCTFPGRIQKKYLSLYIHTYIHTYIHKYIYIYTYIYIYKCIEEELTFYERVIKLIESIFYNIDASFQTSNAEQISLKCNLHTTK